MEEEGEDVKRRVIDFAKESLEIEIGSNEIEARRMGAIQPGNPKPRDVLIRFDNQSLRNMMYQKKKRLREQNQEVFINEDLTMKRSFLFYQARKLRKRQLLFGVWTQAGNILIKISPDSIPLQVNTIDEIKALLSENNNGDSDLNSEMSEMNSQDDLL